MSVCLSVTLYLCSVWPAKRLGRSRPNLTHALMSTQGVFLSTQGQCQGHSCMRAGVTELRNTRNAARKRHLANAAQTPSGRRVITARVTRRGASHRSPVIANFLFIFSNFRNHGNRGWSGSNFTYTVKFANPENPLLGFARILTRLLLVIS